MSGIDWSVAGASAGALLVLLAPWVYLLATRLRLRRLEERAQALERAMRSALAQAARMKEEEQRLQARINRLEETIGQLRLRTDARPYEQAIRLAAHGADEGRLSRTLGLTDGEAQLVKLLHGNRPPPPIRPTRPARPPSRRAAASRSAR